MSDIDNNVNLSIEDMLDQSDDKRYKESTYEIVSKVAYLIGVPKRIFENEYEPPKLSVYLDLEGDRHARIVRHLCILRNAIERNFGRINDQMIFGFRTIMNMPEYIPQETINQLIEDGVPFYKKSHTLLVYHVIEINRLISDRINNCKDIFPDWLNWNYIRELFIMPKGLQEDGTKAAADVYYQNLPFYPYKRYINWVPRNEGNILYNDKKFVTLLYKMHYDTFTAISKVTDAAKEVKDSVRGFINRSDKLAIVVDCENANPYKLVSVLKGLEEESTKKIYKIILIDDPNSVASWSILERHTKIPVEHILIERIKQNKSLVDIKLTAKTCSEHYKDNVDSFIIVSSDSDYWGLISSLPDARFLLMLERRFSSKLLINALVEAKILYCYIDDFYSGNAEEMQLGALFEEMNKYIDANVHLNVYRMFDEALRTTHIRMEEHEKKRFIERYIKTLKISMSEDGEIMVEFVRK